MAKFILQVISVGGTNVVPSIEYSNRPKKEVLEVIGNTIDTYTNIGFFPRMDLRDWLYSTSVLRGIAERTCDGFKFSLTCEQNGNESVDAIAKEHTPYYIPRTQEEIREEYFKRRESGLLPR